MFYTTCFLGTFPTVPLEVFQGKPWKRSKGSLGSVQREALETFQGDCWKRSKEIVRAAKLVKLPVFHTRGRIFYEQCPRRGASLAHHGLEVRLQGLVALEVPQRQAADLVEIIPIVIEFGDVLLPGLVLGVAGVVQVEGADFAYHEGLHAGVVSLLGYQVGLFGDAQLLGLVVEVGHEEEDVLVEVHLLLLDAGQLQVAVALGHLHLPPAFAPVEDGDGEAHLHYLVVQEVAVGGLEIAVLARVAHAGEEVDAAQVAPCGGHGIVGLQLAAADVLREGVAFEGLLQHLFIDDVDVGDHIGDYRVEVLLLGHAQERAELEHLCVEVALGLGDVRLALEGVELQLQEVVLRDLAHLALGLGHFVEAVGVLLVLPGGGQVLLGQEEVEEVGDGGHGHFLRGGDERCLGLGVAHRLDAAVPLDGVHPEDGLRQFETDGDGHELLISPVPQLADVVQRGGERELAARQPDVLVDGEFAPQSQVVVADKGVRTVRILVRAVRLAVAGQGAREVDLRQEVGTEGAVFPIGGLQFVEGHGGIHRLCPCQGDGLGEGDVAFIRQGILLRLRQERHPQAQRQA